jgi:hypothetical protein
MSGLNARLFPTPLPLGYSLYRAPAQCATKVLQGTSPLACEALVAAWPIAAMVEKNVLD